MTTFDQVLGAAKALSPADRGRLVDELLGDLPEPPTAAELPDSVRRELDRRLAEIDANPDNEVAWEDVKREVLEDLRQCHTS
jgi:putative addiction module component (TIGR02574 family)